MTENLEVKNRFIKIESQIIKIRLREEKNGVFFYGKLLNNVSNEQNFVSERPFSYILSGLNL